MTDVQFMTFLLCYLLWVSGSAMIFLIAVLVNTALEIVLK